MSFREGLLKARSSLTFLFGLLFAFGLIYTLDEQMGSKSRQDLPLSPDVPQVSPTALTATELEWGRIAWKYFENNYQVSTGLVNSVDKYPAATIWDTGSYLMAVISAHRLGLVTPDRFHQMISRTLQTLASLPLYDGALPNKSYNTITLRMVNYTNQETERGIGWSAIDIARLIVPLHILMWNYPQHAQEIRTLLDQWDMRRIEKTGFLYGATIDATNQSVQVQEGRLGYEEYAAKAISLRGLDTSGALQYLDFVKFVDIEGILVAVDSRDAKTYQAHTYVLSEPYILDGLEFGWDRISRELAYRVYRAQEERFRHTGIPTAVTEDNVDHPPYFAYNTVYSDGKRWATLSPDGEEIPHLRSLSTKAVFGWHALYHTDYTAMLINRIQSFYDPDRGWYAGIYEKTGEPNKSITANTNGIILESLCFKQFGPLIRMQVPSGPSGGS